VEAQEDDEGHVIVDGCGEHKLMTPNPCVDLPYIYLMAWYIMHCPSLMSAVHASEDSMLFVQRLEL